ncbi:uncharacterized protein LOC111002630 [Pieris rapae]|uniref:uncharacterized protein LOC111002630 n=1 Tax=Pieris rapae TaxID=64459 RepID=UPI001E27CC2F|nr:uncharacterized protein LOC111002630 [Pieris rapae]XP_022128486.2 uncharacterized protein LOC111002630 [Pieris rapae]XP_045490458.1 uncharacterized protein LOC111002630 [Pieris rapae]
MVIMSCISDVALHDRVPVLWQRIEDAHYSYLEIDDSPEKLQQKKKLQGYITEYLSLVPNEYKFGLQETSKVFQRTVNELPDYSAYRAGIGWAAMARYAANLLAQPWRKEYKVVRLYCGFYKHEVEANLVGGESLLQAMGYRSLGGGRLALDGPVCPDMAAAVSRDALIAQCESQIMASIWEGVWSGGGRVSWAAVAAERLAPSRGLFDEDGVYSNMPAPAAPRRHPPCRCPDVASFAFPPCEMPAFPYAVPYYFPLRPSYALPPPLYAPANSGPNDAIDGSIPRRPVVPTARLIEYDSERDEKRSRRVDGPSRSESRPALKAREDGTGTYESWDYVFRNLSSKDREGDGGSCFSQSSDRDSRTLDRLERDDRRKYRPTTLDLEDGLRALDLDRSHDEEASRTAKVNESLMRLKREQESKRVKRRPEERTPEVRKPEERRPKKTEYIGNPSADGLVTPKVAPDKVKLLSKREIKDRKEVLKLTVTGQVSSAEVKKLKRTAKSAAAEAEKTRKPSENGVHEAYGPTSVASSSQPSGLETQLTVSLEDGPAERWQCGTCTYLNARGLHVCDMCGKSKRAPRIQPLTSGGRECPACTLVNRRDAKSCDACGTGLDRCPTYI